MEWLCDTMQAAGGNRKIIDYLDRSREGVELVFGGYVVAILESRRRHVLNVRLSICLDSSAFR